MCVVCKSRDGHSKPRGKFCFLLRSIFLSNGYRGKFIEKLFYSFDNNIFVGSHKCPVYLNLPRIGLIAENNFERALKNTTERTFYAVKLRFIFWTSTILLPTPKDVLPAFSTSSVIYEFKCKCDAGYVGRTSQQQGWQVLFASGCNSTSRVAKLGYKLPKNHRQEGFSCIIKTCFVIFEAPL